MDAKISDTEKHIESAADKANLEPKNAFACLHSIKYTACNIFSNKSYRF
jgi:hypothetical protein